MFACISGNGVGLRLPAATATELQFSRDNVVPFQPGGMASTREWIQIDRAEAADYEKDLELFQASIEFVKAARIRRLYRFTVAEGADTHCQFNNLSLSNHVILNWAG